MRPRKKIVLLIVDQTALSLWRMRLHVRGYEPLAAASVDAAMALLWLHKDCELVMTEPACNALIPGLYAERAIKVLLIGCTVEMAIETCATAAEVAGPYLPSRVIERAKHLLARNRGPKSFELKLLETPMGPLQRAVATLELPGMYLRHRRAKSHEAICAMASAAEPERLAA